MLRFYGKTYLSLLFKPVLRSSKGLQGSNVLLFSEFINIVSILYCTFVVFIILLYIFSVISFARYKEYIVRRISCSKF